ncbi:MAG: tRNA (adenine-N1)-methyltransferase [Anaerolineae bacterium]|nr:tRNA (adenine-N1)-methyltransferase [Anaerolineae bacterium]
MFVTKDRKTFIRTLYPGGTFQSHHGVISYDDLVGRPFGTRLLTHLEQPVWLFPPTPDDLVRHLRRESQIIFPKDLGYILLKLGVQPGARVIEAGTGSGALTLTLAIMVGGEGHVFSYDRRDDMQRVALKNLERNRLQERVTLVERDIVEGFDQQDVHALFLDVPDPWAFEAQAWAALRHGGVLGCIVPTINQVVTLVDVLHSQRWFMVEVEELLLRTYKTLPARIRPDDQMVGHTGFLVFARKVAAE